MDISNNIFISNDCVSARLYQQFQRQFDNPFIWCRMKYEDFSYLLLHYDENTINFQNIKIEDGTNNVVNVDNKMKVYYSHYIQDTKYDTPTRITGHNYLDVRYNDIQTYCVNKYNSRLNRFLSVMTERKPIFILNQKNTLQEFGYGISDEDCNDFLHIETSYTKILVTKNDFNVFSNNEYIVRKNNEDTTEIAKRIIKAVIK